MSNGETPLGGQYDPDELEELESQAERRGTGRGLIIGLLIAAAVAIAAIVFVLMNPLGQQAPPDNTVPVTTLPQATEVAVPETLIVTATPGTALSAQKTGTPAREKPSARTCSVTVLPVPVGPMSSMCGLTLRFHSMTLPSSSTASGMAA